ncbi:hypothetical protein Lgee_1594 [Legionella geestiana]|uniref:Uncharacterized protein n=1 Tax=Legionella geestiana TaxID=45065 RepID=A0A0W0TSX9_9GAMM|nr:hypothetical protein [Legionella geestiana]KTC98517.1 hypothetical protein Lgee_1594 [Legionella geestiana]QBS13080.1 hypothetical protein E4T54_10215 [Legionella geestiana]QDQ39241.1 hypothetical protein E3226_001860 [Legionella geestiana]STX54406.1 Uncharacterised protein [Legionella geestiana]
MFSTKAGVMIFKELDNYVLQNTSKVLINALEMANEPNNICELLPDYFGRVTLHHREGPPVSSLLAHREHIVNRSILLMDGGVSFKFKSMTLPRDSYGEFFEKPSSCNQVKMTFQVGITVPQENAEPVFYRFQVQFDALNLPLEDVQSLAQEDADCMMLEREESGSKCTLM